MSDGAPKSAYELAMERLRKKDEEAGIVRKELTDEQKAQIADVRSLYQSKLAEVELRYQAKALDALDPASRETLDAEYRHDRERLVNERDRRIAKLRGE
jgi:hypothetical protein